MVVSSPSAVRTRALTDCSCRIRISSASLFSLVFCTMTTGSRAESASESRISRIVPAFISGVWLASDVPVTSGVSDDSVSVSVSVDLSDSASDVASAALFDSASDVASASTLPSASAPALTLSPNRNAASITHIIFPSRYFQRFFTSFFICFHSYFQKYIGGRPVRLSVFCAD